MGAELIKLFRYQLGNKEYIEMEGTWLELLETNLDLGELLSLVELAIRWGPSELAVTLLWVLATHLEDQRRYQEELTVLRRIVDLNPQDEKLSRAISACLKSLHGEEPLLEKILQKAGLGYGEPLNEALKRFDRYFSLIPGRLIYDQERGAGRIKNLDLLFDRVLVEFESGFELTVDVQSAGNRFRFPAEEGFFYLKNKEPEKLAQMIATDPAEVVRRYLRDIGKRASAGEIEEALAPLVGRENFSGFWERAKKGLNADPQIVIQNRPVRSYRWVDQPEDRAEVTEGEEKRKAKKGVVSEYDTSELTAQSAQEVLKGFEGLRSASEKKRFLEDLARVRADWESLYALFFLSAIDTRCRSLIMERLQREKPAVWDKLLESILTDYRANADAFLYLAEKGAGFSARQVVSRLLDIMEMDSDRGRRNQARKIIAGENYRLIADALAELNGEEAARLMQRIKSSRSLEPFQQDEIVNLIISRFATLAPNQESTVVWSSAAGIERARRELDFLTQQELPKSAEEIGRARAFGDLSENYEYKAAKERQVRLMEKIRRLQSELKHAQALETDRIDTSRVNIGCRVQLADEEGRIQEFAILGPWDSNPEKGIISFQSPLATQLLGKKLGESVVMGEKKWTVRMITKAL